MLQIEWLDNYTPTGKRMLTLTREAIEFKNGKIADVFYCDEFCVIEIYEGWGGELVDVVRWCGPRAREECELYVAEMVLD